MFEFTRVNTKDDHEGDIEQGNLYPGISHGENQIRWGFIRKVYGILAAQMVLTTAVSCLTVLYAHINDLLRGNSGLLPFIHFLVMRDLKLYVGADITSMVSLPVLIFEPMKMLQKMAELMEYAHLLEQADNCEDPYMRLVCRASWFISVYYALQRTWKPFNPILGETYEMINHNGITFIVEQVLTSKVKTKFLGNTNDVYPLGRPRLKLKKDGVILEQVPPPTKVNNLIFGRTWIDSPGEMVLTNLTSGDKITIVGILTIDQHLTITTLLN